VLLDANDNARLTDFGYASLIGEIPEALAYLQMSTRQPGTLRWAAPEQIKEDTCQPTTKSDIYSFGNLALQASALATKPSSALSLLQVFSGKLPWSEVRGNAAIVLLLAQGQKPRRPQSRPVDDRHWEFIERCWSEVQERPSASDIVPALQHFLASLPLSPRLGDFLRLSTQLPDSRPTSSGSPLSLTDMDVDDDDKTNDVDDTSIAHSVLTAHPGCSDSPMQVYLAPSQDDVFSSPQLPAASPLSPLPPDVKMLSPPMRLEDTFPQQDVGSEPHYVKTPSPRSRVLWLKGSCRMWIISAVGRVSKVTLTRLSF
jgi:serine/threonine protein kinase